MQLLTSASFIYFFNHKRYLVNHLTYFTTIFNINKKKVISFFYAICLTYIIINYIFYLRGESESLCNSEHIESCSINYVFISDSLYLDGYNIDYMSSGNKNYYDPVRDTFTEITDKDNGPLIPGQTEVLTDSTHTDFLADYLKSVNTKNFIYEKHIRFRDIGRLPPTAKYMSKIAICVKKDYPHLFHKNAGSTKIDRKFLDALYSLKKNYDLTR